MLVVGVQVKALPRKLVAALAAAVVVLGIGFLVFSGGEKQITINADFSSAVGLYKGSSVRVLGVSVGKITSITPQGTTVRVSMRVSAKQKIPVDAIGYIIAPSLVSDRYVQFGPVYAGGPAIADGMTVPIERTRTPVEVDAILASLDNLFKALGPNGANKQGSLSRALHVGARVLNGTGADINTTINKLSDAIATISNHRDDLISVVTNLADFSQTLADSDTTVRNFSASLAGAAQQLAQQRTELGDALKNLSIALGEVGNLIRDHRDTLVADVSTLKDVTNTLLAHERSLKEALDVLPLGVTNLGLAVDPRNNSVDIRQDNQQTNDPTTIVLCQVLSPLLGIKCPVAGTSPGAPAGPLPLTVPNLGSGRTAAIPGVPDLSLRGLLDGAG